MEADRDTDLLSQPIRNGLTPCDRGLAIQLAVCPGFAICSSHEGKGVWLLGSLIQGIGWELGELGFIDKVPENNNPLVTVRPHYPPKPTLQEYVQPFPARGMTLGQIIGVLMGGIFGSNTKSP